MERFRKYMGRDLNLENVKDSGRLAAYGIQCTYLSDPPEDFDEIEFRCDFVGKDSIAITVAIEMGKIKRVMFGVADEQEPDVIKSLTGPQLEGFLREKGETLVRFFEFITG